MLVAFALAPLGACMVDLPERGSRSGDAVVDAGGGLGGDLNRLTSDARSPDAAPRPDAAPPPPDAALVADRGPPPADADVAPPADTGPAVEICDGVDNDADGTVDEEGDAECLSRHGSARFCIAGECKACNPETNEGCGAHFTCVATRSENVCAQCTPAANTCPAESPYCSPQELVCLACPELVSYNTGEFANRCSGPPFGGHCVYLFHASAETPASCGGLCQAIGMGCREGWFSEPAEPGEPAVACRAGDAVACEADRLGELICDCIQ